MDKEYLTVQAFGTFLWPVIIRCRPLRGNGVSKLAAIITIMDGELRETIPAIFILAEVLMTICFWPQAQITWDTTRFLQVAILLIVATHIMAPFRELEPMVTWMLL